MEHKRQWVEWSKTVGIVLLSVSAVLLAIKAYFLPNLSLTSQSPFHWATDWILQINGKSQETIQTGVQMASAPIRIVISSASGRRCVQYATAETESVFGQVGGLLSEALQKAQSPKKVTEAQFRKALQTEGCFFEWMEAVPLSSLCAWLNAGMENGKMMHSAKRVLVGTDEAGALCLYYINAADGMYYACGLGEISQETLTRTVTGYISNGARFAFEADLDSAVDPYWILINGVSTLPVLESRNPLDTEKAVDQLFEALGLNYHTMSGYQVEGGRVYKQEGTAIRLTQNGEVAYTGNALDRFPVPCAGTAPVKTEVIEGARRLVEQLMEPFYGDLAQFYLAEIEKQEHGGYLVRFGCQVEGAPIFLSAGEYAAEIQMEGPEISSFILRFRQYTFSGSRVTLLPLNQAISTVSAQGKTGISFLKGYIDDGGTELIADWITQAQLSQ
ncbi:MAG: hypothetical protein ACOX0U_03465 [Oscillospiraceae bacterium]|jgi:hypothetical protein